MSAGLVDIPSAEALDVDANEDESADAEERDDSQVVGPVRYSITSYGADYPVDGLVKRMREGSICVPRFQRKLVWDIVRASRFVESLLLGLPVPGIFLSRDPNTQMLLVIDGQQRLRTLQYFFDGYFEDPGRTFWLRGVQKPFDGLAYEDLREGDKRRLDDSILHATIVRQDRPEDDHSSIYYIFERLNTGGMILRPQEIRAAIYPGPLNDLLAELSQDETWLHLVGNLTSRMRDQELILRFFALYYGQKGYTRPMKEFLNAYMQRNRAASPEQQQELRRLFLETVQAVYSRIGRDAFRRPGVKAVNAAILDSVMVGVARRLAGQPLSTAEGLRAAHERLLNDTKYIDAVRTGTSSEDLVNLRLDMATTAFAGVR